MPGHYDLKLPEGYDPRIALLLGALDDSSREWRGEFGKPPVEAIVWQPYPGAHSIGGILLHMAAVESYWFEAFAGGRTRPDEERKLFMSDEIDVDGVNWPAPPNQPIEWYLEIMNRIRARSIEALKGLPADKHYERGDFSCTLQWVVSHVVQHDSYHGGQAVLLHELWKKDQGQKG